MRARSTPRAAAAIVAALAAMLICASAAGAAVAGGLEASFEYTPAQPDPGEEITFRSTSTSGSTAPMQYSWDLNGDGQFGDASGPSAKASFAAAGTYIVRLRVTQGNLAGGGTDTAEREIVVGEPPPTPPQEPTPPEAEPQPGNEPPVALYKRDCSKTGTLILCKGLVAREGVPKTLDASTSSDPDGSIVKYEWDLDANGQFEHDTGANPTLEHTFEPLSGLVDARNRAVTVRVTDDKGSSATDTVRIHVLEPACEPSMSYGRIKASGQCLRKRAVEIDGKDWLRYYSTEPVVVNGITLAPLPNRRVFVEVPAVQTSSLQPVIRSTGARVVVPVKGSTSELVRGQFSWKVGNNRLLNFSLGSARLNGLAISGMPEQPLLNSDGTSTFKIHLALPQQFGGASSEQPITFSPGGVTAAGEAFQFTVEDAAIGPVGLDELTVKYDGEDFWEVFADVQLPEPISYGIEGGAGIRGGNFEYAKGALDFGSPGVGPFGPVFLQRISFRIEIKPQKSECVPKIGVEVFDLREELHEITGKWYDVDPVVVDHGIPTFALCGGVKLTAGPQILGASAISLDAGLGFATYADRPNVFRAFGDVSLIEIPLAKATFEAHTNGYVRMFARFGWAIPDVASISGFVKFEMLMPRFNAEGRVEACLDLIDLCAGARALVSSKGVAVCLKIDVILDDWEPGFGYVWGDTFPDLYFSGCDVGPYREHIDNPGVQKRAPGGPDGRLLKPGDEQTVDLPAGLPGAAIAVTGRDAPPKVTLIGPNGERVTTPDDNKAVQQRPFLLIKNPKGNLTQIAVGKPAAGRWRVVVEEGSSDIVSVKSAEGLEPAKVDARVTGRGHQRAIDYEVEPREGQRVTFVERGPSTGNYLGEAKGRTGSIRFAPADGSAEKREIVAIVEQNGQIRDEVVVTQYAAPAPQRPAKPKRLTARRRGNALVLSWKPARPADRQEVMVRLSDGRRVFRQTKRGSLKVPRVRRGVRAGVSVRGVMENGLKGPAAKAKVPLR